MLNDQLHNTLLSSLAGMAAGLAQTLIITPVDLLKIRQQIQTSVPGTAGFVGPLQLLARILRQEGVTGAL